MPDSCPEECEDPDGEPCLTCGEPDAECTCCRNCGAPRGRGSYGHCSRCAPFFDPLKLDTERSTEETTCGECGAAYVRVKALVDRGQDVYALYVAALHRHGGEAEAWINVILGTFDSDGPSDHVTFGCRVGPVEDQPNPAATLVPAASTYPDLPIWGHKLSRDEALEHTRLWEFWDVVDLALAEDPDIHRHVYGEAQGSHDRLGSDR